MASAELTLTILDDRLGEFSDTAKGFRRWMMALSVIANNLPDLDLIYSMDTKLDYLIHHRGHTHTIALAVPMALLLMVAPAVRNWWRPLGWKSIHWTLLSVVVVVGAFLHLIFDSANNYGVHPFWPLDKRWCYGDTIFIIEPWWWITLLGVFYHGLESWWGRLAGGDRKNECPFRSYHDHTTAQKRVYFSVFRVAKGWARSSAHLCLILLS